MDAPIVIVGAGMAAYSLARELRKLDRERELVIVSADAGHAYAKPMLSNALAMGKDARQLVSQEAAQMAKQLNAQIWSHTTVLAVDTVARVIDTTRGPLAYGSLVLATGAQPVRLALEGGAAHEVLHVNHLDEYAQLRARLDALPGPARVAILGGGVSGCEFADDLLAAGHDVTLIDPRPRLLAALAPPSLSQGLADALAGRGARLHMNTVAQALVRSDGALALALADGSVIEADLVLSAAGLCPNIALARAAGITTARGILVDRFGRTSAAHVYALGDCAQYQTVHGAALLPYVAPMLTAARAIAATLSGRPTVIALRKEPVLVKTPSYRMALLPPPAAIDGAWQDVRQEGRTVSRFVGRDRVLHGFGASHSTPALRQSLLAELHAR